MFGRILAVLIGVAVVLRSTAAGAPLEQRALCKLDPAILCRLGQEEAAAANRVLVSHTPVEVIHEAQSFVRAYPQSQFLYWVYDSLAKAYWKLGRDSEALQFAEQSLRVHPENPNLQLEVARRFAHRKMARNAVAYAVQAIEYSEDLQKPITKVFLDWAPERETQLAASTIIGSAVMSVDDSKPLEGQQLHWLSKAISAIRRQVINDSKRTTDYLLTRGDEQRAISESMLWAAIEDLPTSVKSEVMERWQRLYSDEGRVVAWDAFVESLSRRFFTRVSRNAAALLPKWENDVDAESRYSGSSSTCAGGGCHRSHYASWSQTGMAKMLIPYAWQNSGEDLAHIPANQSFTVRSVPLGRMVETNRRHFIELWKQGRGWVPYQIDYIIGSQGQQAYATRAVDGHVYVLPIEYNIAEKRWFVYGDDPEDVQLRKIETFEVPPVGIVSDADGIREFASTCARCHTTRLTATPQELPNSYQEPGVGCEMCHGPLEAHVIWQRQNRPAIRHNTSDPAPAFVPKTAVHFAMACLPCHSQSVSWPAGVNLNFTGKRWPFMPVGVHVSLDHFDSSIMYSDGRLRQTTFIGEAFRRSKCFQLGDAQCGNCHRIHRSDSAQATVNSTKRLLQFDAESDEMCVGCHAQYANSEALSNHSHHKDEGKERDGRRCVRCHMPPIMTGPPGMVRTHTIDDIPNAAALARFGREGSPNACVICHGDKPDGWIIQQLENWTKRPVT